MLKQRVITALILAPIAVAGIFLLPPLEFACFIGVFIVVAAWEWANLAGLEGVARFVYAGVIALLLSAAWFLPSLWILCLLYNSDAADEWDGFGLGVASSIYKK
ncbi:MAG: phosphatidate cytidylyltransferase, partial [Pseudomonadales bacterium]|nr:phosphatidate cytidylyltransferase [Pseudomonadales bacterium]